MGVTNVSKEWFQFDVDIPASQNPTVLLKFIESSPFVSGMVQFNFAPFPLVLRDVSAQIFLSGRTMKNFDHPVTYFEKQRSIKIASRARFRFLGNLRFQSYSFSCHTWFPLRHGKFHPTKKKNKELETFPCVTPHRILKVQLERTAPVGWESFFSIFVYMEMAQAPMR